MVSREVKPDKKMVCSLCGQQKGNEKVCGNCGNIFQDEIPAKMKDVSFQDLESESITDSKLHSISNESVESNFGQVHGYQVLEGRNKTENLQSQTPYFEDQIGNAVYLLALLIPLAGFVIFFTIRTEKPKSAIKVAIAGLISIILYVLLGVY